MQTKQKFISFWNNLKQQLIDLRTNRTFLICCLLTVLYLISGYCKWIEILMSLTALTFMAILPLQSALCIFMYLHSFTLSNITFDSCFLITFIGFCFILLVKYIIGLLKGKYQFHKKLILAFSWFMTFSLIVSLFHNAYVGGLLFLCYPPFLYFVFTMRKEFNIKQAMNYMFAGLLATSILAVIIWLFPKYQYHTIYFNRFQAFTNNANYLYLRCLFVLSYYIYQYLNKNLSNTKFILIYLLCTILTLSTASKTGTFMLLLISAIFVVAFLKQDFKKHIKLLLIFLAVLLLISLICYKIVLNVVNRYVTSFESETFITSLLTGRNKIWATYFDAIFSSPWTMLFGHGVTAQELYVTQLASIMSPHNLYVFLLYRFGLLGCLFLGFLIYKAIKMCIFEKPKFIAYIPLIYLLIESLCDNTFRCYNFTLFAFAIMILFMTNYETNNPTEKNKLK